MRWPGQAPASAPANKDVTFPNISRCYDAPRRAVAFWGYDRSMERSFFVTWDALARIQPNLNSGEVGMLSAFDNNRNLIHQIAAKVYGRGQKAVYVLNTVDF